MKSYNDYGVSFAQTMILKTPPGARAKKLKGTKSPWDRSAQARGQLVNKLREAEARHNFYSSLYRQYSINLLKLVIYSRSLITNGRVAAYMEQAHPELFATLKDVIVNAEG